MSGATFGRKGLAGGIAAPRRAPAFGAAAPAQPPLSPDEEMAARREAFIAAERARNGGAAAPAATQVQQQKIERLARALTPRPPETFEGKSYPVAFLLWMLLGVAGAHRLYLGRRISGGILAAMFTVSVGLLATGYYPAFLGLVACTLGMLADGRLIGRMSKARRR